MRGILVQFINYRMQITSKEIYKKVSVDNNIPIELIKNIGDYVFNELYQFMQSPTALIVKVKSLGSWYLRKKKLEEFIFRHHTSFTKDEIPEFSREESLERYLKQKAQYEVLLDRWEEYQRYKEKKEEIKEIRNKTQPFIKPKIEEEC